MCIGCYTLLVNTKLTLSAPAIEVGFLNDSSVVIEESNTAILCIGIVDGFFDEPFTVAATRQGGNATGKGEMKKCLFLTVLFQYNKSTPSASQISCSV